PMRTARCAARRPGCQVRLPDLSERRVVEHLPRSAAFIVVFDVVRSAQGHRAERASPFMPIPPVSVWCASDGRPQTWQPCSRMKARYFGALSVWGFGIIPPRSLDGSAGIVDLVVYIHARLKLCEQAVGRMILLPGPHV